MSFALLFSLEVVKEVIGKIRFSCIFQYLLEEVFVFLHELLNFLLVQQCVLEDAIVSFLTNTCTVEILAGELLGLMRIVAAVGSMAIAGEEELA